MLDVRRFPTVAPVAVSGIIHRNPVSAAGKRRASTTARTGFCIEASGGNEWQSQSLSMGNWSRCLTPSRNRKPWWCAGLLESAGIEAIIQNIDAPQDVLPGVGGVVVLVRPDQAEDARETIEAYSQNPTTDADEAVTEEPG